MIAMAKPDLGIEEKQAVLEVIDSGMIAQGPRTKAFEEAFAQMCTTRFAAATSNGTTALHVALLAHGIGPEDEVITTPFTFIASANSILYTGARPVFVDINPLTFNLDANQLEAAISPNTRAIMPVHLFGLCCDMDPIMALAQRHNLAIIEDACQSHGAAYHGKRAGSFGTGVFSLYPTKNITSGEGGMITTDDPEVDELCRVIRNHGMRRRYYHDQLGFNFRMSDLHAAIGLAQLGKLGQYNAARQTNAAYLSANLKGVQTPYIPPEYEHVFHQYTVRVPAGQRDALREHLRRCEVGSEVYYPVPVHQQSFYKTELGFDEHHPLAEKAAAEVLSLPVHPALTQADLDQIVEGVNSFFA